MLAAVALLRQAAPDLAVQAVNVVDLLRLETPGDHPGGLSEAAFAELFTAGCPVVFAFHGYPMVVHELLHGRPEPQRFHVHGYREEGTTTTPFDMLVLNRMSRFDLANDALAALRPGWQPVRRRPGAASRVDRRARRRPAGHPGMALAAAGFLITGLVATMPTAFTLADA